MTAAVATGGVTMASGTPVDTSGTGNLLNLTAATLIKATPGRLVRLNVLIPGAAAGAVYDSASVNGNGAANQTFAIPTMIGTYYLDWPHMVGIVVSPGSGQTVSVSYV